MEVSEHLDALRREGGLLADAAESHGLNAPIPTCPDWTMRDLVRHTGGIHRWATAHVAGRLTTPIATLEEVVGQWPDDPELVGWFRAGHAALFETLANADPAVECFTFLPAPSPLAFWARRQAHETGMHRFDAESAAGAHEAVHAAHPLEIAVDGIDELLLGFGARPNKRLVSDEPRAMHLHATDADADWVVTVTPEGPRSVRSHPDPDGKADCTVSAPAADLYTLLWNRRTPDGLAVAGDGSLLGAWAGAIQIRFR